MNKLRLRSNIGVRGFPLRPIPSLGAMGPGPGHLGKLFSARRRRRRRRRRPWGLFFKKSNFLKTVSPAVWRMADIQKNNN